MLTASSRRDEPGLDSKLTGSQNLGLPFLVILKTIAIFFLSQVIAVVVVGVVYQLITGNKQIDIDKSITAQFFFILMAEGLAASAAIWLVKRRRLSLAVIGLGRRPKRKDLVAALIGFGVFYAVLIAVGIVVNIFWPNLSNEKQDLGFNNISTSTQNALALIALVVLPPIGEEILVRGYLYSGLRKFWRLWPAVLVTSLVFGAAHLEFGSGGPLVWAAAIDTFLLSVVLCFLREKTGVLYAGILVHLVNNLIAFGVNFK